MSQVLERLQLIMEADTANYISQMRQAGSESRSVFGDIMTAANTMATVMTASMGIAASAMGAIVTQQAELAGEIERASNLATVNTDTFQYWAAGARAVGVEQEKLGDILKDTNDKIGDFLANEGGEMQDFFKNVAPKIGVTADQFRGLSGAEGLQLYYDSLVKANVGSAEMTFYMESIADEASALMPLLKNGGEQLKYWGELAKDTGYIMSKELIAAAKAFGEETKVMGMRWQGFKNQVSELVFPPLTAWLDDLNKTGGAFDTLSKSIIASMHGIGEWIDNGGLHQITGLVGVAAVGAFVQFGASVGATIPTLYAQSTALMANTGATIANATSQERLGAVLMALVQGHTPAQMALHRYTTAMTGAITATAAFVRNLPAKITGLGASTTAILGNTRAMLANATANLTMANAQKVAIGSSILLGRGVLGVGAALGGVAAILRANPLLTLAAIMSAIVIKAEGLQGAIKSLGDTARLAGVMFEDFVSNAVDGWGMIFDVAGDVLSGLVGNTDKSTVSMTGYFGEMFKNTQGGFVGLVQVGASVFDNLVTYGVTFAKMTVQNLSNGWIAIKNGVRAMGNTITSILEGTANVGVRFVNSMIDRVNELIRGISSVSVFFGGQAISEIKHVAPVSVGRLSYEEYAINPNFDTQLSQNKVTAARNYVDESIKSGQKQAKANEAVTKSLQEQQRAYAGVENKADEAGKAGEKAAKKVKQANDKANQAVFDLAKNMTEQLIEWNKQWWLWNRYPVNELLNTQTAKIDYEANNIHGKFFGLDQSVKDLMADTARTMDEISAGAELYEKNIDLAKQLYALKNSDSEYLSLRYDLYNDANPLSLAAENVKQETLDFAAHRELASYQNSIRETIESLREQDNLLAESSKFAQDLAVIENTRLKTLGKYEYLKEIHENYYEDIEQSANELAEMNKRLVVQTAYKEIVKSQISDEENKLNILKEQLDIISEQHKLYEKHSASNSMLDPNHRDILDNARVSVLHNALGLPKKELSPMEQLNKKFDDGNKLIDIYEKNGLEKYKNDQDTMTKIMQEAQTAREILTKNHRQNMLDLQLSMSQDMLGSLANTSKTAFGEQSKFYRATFAAERGVAIARAMLALKSNIAQASKIGFPANIPMIAGAFAQGMSIVNDIRALKAPVIGQAHDGIMSVPKSGTWNLEKGERVLPRHTAQNLDNTLNRLQGRGETKVIINNYTGESVQTEHQDNGDLMITIGKMVGDAIDYKLAERDAKSHRQGWGY